MVNPIWRCLAAVPGSFFDSFLQPLDVGESQRRMPRLAVDTDVPASGHERSESLSPLAQRFVGSPTGEPMSTDVSPLQAPRDTHTLSPIALMNHRGLKLPIDSTVEQMDNVVRANRQAPSKSAALTSFTSSATRQPPSSDVETTPQPRFIKHHGEFTPGPETIPLQYNSALRTPPPNPNRALTSPSTVKPSPNRASSVPLSPVHRPALIEGSEEGPVSPHRVTSAMAKRSARNRSDRKAPLLPLASEYSLSPSKPGGSKQMLVSEDVEEEVEEDDVDEPQVLEPNPIAATQSMPELGESPEIHKRPFLAFLPRIIETENAKKTQRPNCSEDPKLTLTEHSAEQDTESSSMGSREMMEYARDRLDKDMMDRREFRLTQVEPGLNPPGIFVNSQSQSDHGYSHPYSHSSGDRASFVDGRRGLGQRKPTTLVVGTPSTNSESSQPEKGFDVSLSQLTRDGKALLFRESAEEWLRTQTVAATQELIATQDLGVTQVAHEVGMGLTEDAVEEYLEMGPPQISPRKQKGYQQFPKKRNGSSVSPQKNGYQDSSQQQKGFWSSSSGASSSIPGLSMTKSSATHPGNNLISQNSVSRVTRNQNASPTKSNYPTKNEESPSKASPIKSNPAKVSKSPSKPGFPNGLRSTRPPNPLRLSRPQDNNIPAPGSADVQVYTTSRYFHSVPNPLKQTVEVPVPTKPSKSVPNPLKRNPLVRRKSPAAFDQHLFKPSSEEDKMPFEQSLLGGSGLSREETLPVEETQSPQATLTSSEPSRRIKGGEAEALHVKHAESAHSEASESVVMDTDGEGVELLETLPLDDAKHEEYQVPIHDMTESPEQIQQEVEDEQEKPVTLSGKTLFSSKGSDARTLSVNPSSSKGSKGSKSSAKSAKKAQKAASGKNMRIPQEDYEGVSSSESSEHDDTGDYKPGDTQSQSQQEGTAVVLDRDEDSDPDMLFSRDRYGTGSRKRNAKSQTGPATGAKRRRMNSPKVTPTLPTLVPASLRKPNQPDSPTAKKPILPPLQTSGAQFVGVRRNTRNRGQSNARAVTGAQIGHLVMVRFPDAKRYYPGHAVERAGRSWQVEPCDGGAAVFAEPKFIRRCEFRAGDLVTVAPGGDGGEDCGDAMVIGLDERWEEARAVLVRIGGDGGEERHVQVRYLSVQERHIKGWDDRKVTHKDLEKDDGAESIPSAALTRTTSMVIPNALKASGNSINRIPQIQPANYFKGVGFLLTGCDPLITKRLIEAGGYIYESWLGAYKFDGGFEKVRRQGTQRRWIRKQPSTGGGRGRSKSTETPALQWIGNRDEQNVKTLFVVAGGEVKLTPKTLIGLAFGVPYVSHKWIEACYLAGERLSWIHYLLPSHNLPNPLFIGGGSGSPTQYPDYQWGLYDSFAPLDDILHHPPLLHRRILVNKPRVLYIAPQCIERLKEDEEEHESSPCKVPFVYCCLAMGAQHMEAVEAYTDATDPTLSKYDLIIMADTLLESVNERNSRYQNLEQALANARAGGSMVINQSDMKMSIACGKLLAIPDPTSPNL